MKTTRRLSRHFAGTAQLENESRYPWSMATKLIDHMKAALITLLLATATVAGPLWNHDGNRSLELEGKDGRIIRFVVDCAPRDPHFEILATPDGRNSVWVGPQDHVWHYGHWFSWKYINGVNFWETNPKTGKQPGLNRIEDAGIESQPRAAAAIIRYRELAHPDPDGAAVLEDEVEIKIDRPTDERGPQVTWKITTKALADVTLDRTPLPDEPGGREWGGYGGLSWRGSKEFAELKFTDSEGRGDMNIHRQHASWVNITGSLHGKPAGLVIINHPGNPRHPTSWYLSNNPKHPFWFANPALLQPKAISLKKGESFQHAYRIILHDGAWDNTQCENAAANFARSE